MDKKTKAAILKEIQSWIRDEFAEAHKTNLLKLSHLNEFSPNPFIWPYLGHFFDGNNKAETLAKVLVYPRILGTSISTSFGSQFQKMMVKIFDNVQPSMIKGTDLTIIDRTDNITKYCQVKSGPNVINHDDVETIESHFQEAINRARANHMRVSNEDFMFCLLYGDDGQENNWIKKIKQNYPVSMGQDFWTRVTGDKDFYTDLITAIRDISTQINMKNEISGVVKDLAIQIEDQYREITL